MVIVLANVSTTAFAEEGYKAYRPSVNMLLQRPSSWSVSPFRIRYREFNPMHSRIVQGSRIWNFHRECKPWSRMC